LLFEIGFVFSRVYNMFQISDGVSVPPFSQHSTKTDLIGTLNKIAPFTPPNIIGFPVREEDY
jgi:hypothetical protein